MHIVHSLLGMLVILGFAVLMLGWHNVWMAREGRRIAVDMKSLGASVVTGQKSMAALAIVVGAAVLREGSEVVLFLYGIALSGGDSVISMIVGGLSGLGLGATISALMYFGLLRIPSRHLFAVTSWLITFLAAGMASQATVFLQQAGIVTILPHVVWDSSAILSVGSMFGKALHTLVGYTDRPTAIQLVVYASTLFTITALVKVIGRTPATQPILKSKS